MGRYIGLTCSLELSVAFRTRWKLFGSFANLIGPRDESVSKGHVLLETATVLHDTTLVLTYGSYAAGLIRSPILICSRAAVCSLVNRNRIRTLKNLN